MTAHTDRLTSTVLDALRLYRSVQAWNERAVASTDAERELAALRNELAEQAYDMICASGLRALPAATPPGEAWWQDWSNVVTLLSYLASHGTSATDVAYAAEKPWKYESEWQASASIEASVRHLRPVPSE